MAGRSSIFGGAACLMILAFPAAAQGGPTIQTPAPGGGRFEIVAGGAGAPLGWRVEGLKADKASAPSPKAQAMTVRAAPAPQVVAPAATIVADAPIERAPKPAETASSPAAQPASDPVVTATMPPERMAKPEVRSTGDDNVKLVRTGEALMQEAVRRAQSSLDEFIESAKAPPEGARGFAVKVALGPKDARENIWVSALERRVRRKAFIKVSESWSGRLANAPVRLEGYKAGDRVSFSASDIRDWTYRAADGRMMGNFTACAIAAGDGQETLARLTTAMRMDCAWVGAARQAAH